MNIPKTNIHLYKQWYYALLLAMLSPLLSSCNDTLDTSTDIPDSSVTLRVSALNKIGTQIKEVSRDNKIADLDILVFDSKNEFAYKGVVTDLTWDDGDYIISTRLTVSDSEKDTYNIVLLANSRYELARQYIRKGDPIGEVLNSLNFSAKAEEEDESIVSCWNDQEKLIPMWGETSQVEVRKSGLYTLSSGLTKSKKIERINLLRAVAKVHISMQSQSRFTENVDHELQEVYAYNSVNKGRIAPTYSAKSYDVESPTLPSLSKDNYEQVVLVQKGAEGEFYLLENKVQPEANRTMLAVGLQHRESSVVRYYKLEIRNEFDKKNKLLSDPKFSPLLRNREYDIEIVNVKGAGSSTPDEAIAGQSACEVTLSVSDWKTYIREIDLQGKEFFSIKNREIVFPFFSFKPLVLDGTTEYKEVKVSNTKQVSIQTNLLSKYVHLKGDDELTDKMGIIDQVGVFKTNKLYDLSLQYGDKQQISYKDTLNHTLTIDPQLDTSNGEVSMSHFDLKIAQLDVPMTIKTLKAGSLPNKETTCVPYGTYVKGRTVNRLFKGHYVLLLIPIDQNNVGIGSEIHAYTSSENFTDYGIKFYTESNFDDTNIYSYRITKQDIRVLEDKRGVLCDYAVVPLLAKGKPTNVGEGTFTLNYSVITGDELCNGELKFKLDIYEYLGDKDIMVTPKVLFVADQYDFSPAVVEPSGITSILDELMTAIVNGVLDEAKRLAKKYTEVLGAFDPYLESNKNLARLLFNEEIFGLNRYSNIAMHPYLDENDNLNEGYIKRVNSLADLGSPDNLRDYDVVFYINSAVSDELYNSPSYVRMLTELIKSEEIVFIQAPSRTVSYGTYTDKVMLSLFKEALEVNHSSPMTKNERVIYVEGQGKPESMFKDTYKHSYLMLRNNLLDYVTDPKVATRAFEHLEYNNDLAAGIDKVKDFSKILRIGKDMFNTHDDAVFFPQNPSNGFFTMRYDLSYLDMPPTSDTFKKYFNCIGRDFIFWELLNMDNALDSFLNLLNSKNVDFGYRPVIAEAKDYNYLWVGSSYFFDDRSMAVIEAKEYNKKYYYPLVSHHKPIYGGWGGLISEQIPTHSALFFVNIMHWAIDKTQEKYERKSQSIFSHLKEDEK